jgi:hypothetical protein
LTTFLQAFEACCGVPKIIKFVNSFAIFLQKKRRREKVKQKARERKRERGRGEERRERERARKSE